MRAPNEIEESTALIVVTVALLAWVGYKLVTDWLPNAAEATNEATGKVANQITGMGEIPGQTPAQQKVSDAAVGASAWDVIWGNFW